MKVLAYGEVLFDVVGMKEEIGGAPFNFSAHMARLGAKVELMSAVGKDDRGAQVRKYLQKYRVPDRLLAETEYPTGVCQVTLNAQGVPSYELVKPAAWDNIPWTETICEKITEEDYDLLYFGSLSQREPISEETLHWVLEKVSSRYRLFDCNIRPPFATRKTVRQGLECCTHLKVSREEAPSLTELKVVPTYEDNRRQEWCRAVAEAYGLEQCSSHWTRMVRRCTTRRMGNMLNSRPSRLRWFPLSEQGTALQRAIWPLCSAATLSTFLCTRPYSSAAVSSSPPVPSRKSKKKGLSITKASQR